MSRLKVNNFSINWLSEDSHYFFDTTHPEAKKFKALAGKMPFYPGHIYLFTSSFKKVVLLSKAAFLISARSVNRYLDCQPKGRWLIPLPLFHVAGLSVLARSFSGGYSFIKQDGVWKAESFVKDLTSKKISYTSLVPAQVYDVVKKNLSPPNCLEFALVGGGRLSDTLYKKARALGWPLLPTYGMTETCSQIATAGRASLNKEDSPVLKILSHVAVREKKGILELKSPSLLTGYFCISSKKFYDPKISEGWFLTQDRGELKDGWIDLKGRFDEWIKISGHLVSLEKLSGRIEDIARKITSEKEFCLIALPHDRKGNQVALVTDCSDFNTTSKILNQFNKNLPVYEKVKSVYIIKKIPRTVLSKIDKVELKKHLH